MDNDLIELAKKKAGYAAVNDYITDGMVVGIGSGSTVIYAVERLIQRVQQEKLHITCIPTSFQATQLIVDGGLILGDLSRFPVIDVDIDGADEVDSNLNLIKGGGGCHVQEKILAQNSKQMIVVADYRKDSQQLGEQWKKGIPVEIIPIACVPLLQKFRTLGGIPTLRMAKNKAGPVISDNGHFIIDVDFGVLSDPASLAAELKQLTGVVDTGLFVNLAQKAYFGQADGSVSTQNCLEDNFMPFITLSNGPTYYELDGTTSVDLIVFIHGFSSPSQVWDPSFEFFKNQGYQVLRYDLYGRGRSAKPDGKYTENFLVGQLSELVHALSLSSKPFTIIGMSMGGVIAAYFIKKYPTLVNRLVLIDTAGFPWSPQLVPKMLRIPLINKKIFAVRAKKALLSKHQAYLEKMGKEIPYADIYARQFQEKPYLNALLSTLLHFPTQSSEEVFLHIGQMPIPKLLIWGEEDETIPFSISDQVIKTLPGVEFHSIPGAGHMPHFEQPDVVNPILLAFLRSN